MIQITKPTLIVDEQKAKANIRRMKAKADRNKIPLRPHFKTHQSADIGEWFREAGIDRIAVSSVSMAEYFADNGWRDITVAFPYNPLESETISKIASSAKINVLIESKEALSHLQSHTPDGVSYFVKIDVGTSRTGIPSTRLNDLKHLIENGSEAHAFLGIVAHAGHSYRSRSIKKIQHVYDEGMEIIDQIEQFLGFRPFVSWGDTPTCSVIEDLGRIDELRAGNFVFYDVMQQQIGSCEMSDIAVAMACPVVALHPNRDEAVIYGGAVHFSKDMIARGATPGYFGDIVHFTEEGWSGRNEAVLARISQEHGIIKGSSAYINSLKLGDIVGVLPVHSCLAADLMPGYMTLEGKFISKISKSL